MNVPVLDTTKRWYCPACKLEHVTSEARPHTPMHACAGLSGLTAPFVEQGDTAVHKLVVRDDYVAGENGLQYIDGRPITSLVTEHADGSNDCTIYAPCVRVGSQAPTP